MTRASAGRRPGPRSGVLLVVAAAFASACLSASARAAAPDPAVAAFVEAWRAAWQAQDLDAYLGFYAADARSGERPRPAFDAYKATLFRRGETVAVRVGELAVGETTLAGEELVSLSFLQDYRSPSHSDTGRKQLLLRRTPAGLRIVRETWQAAPWPAGQPAQPPPPAPPVAAAPPVERPKLVPGAPGGLVQLEPAPLPPPRHEPPFAVPVFPGLPPAMGDGREVVEEIIARVNGRILTRSMFLRRLTMQYDQLREENPPDVDERIATLARDTLDRTIERWLILQEAKDRQADIEGFWRTRLVQLRQQVGAKDLTELSELLAEQGTTLDELKEQIVEQEIPSMYIQREVMEKIDVSDARVREAYTAQADRYRVPAHVTLRQVLVPVDQDTSADKATAVANQAIGDLLAGKEWCQVAATYGHSVTPCGDVGTVPLDDLLPELREAAAGLPIAAVSKPIRTAQGIHVLQVTARDEARVQPFEVVQDRVREDLFEHDRDQRIDALVKELRRRGEVTINPRYASMSSSATPVSQ